MGIFNKNKDTLSFRGRGAFLSEIRRNKTLLIMLLPAVALVFVFAYMPMGGMVLAFKQFKYDDGIFGSPWVGFNNFKFFFLSGQAFRVTLNTFLYNLAFIVVNTVLQIGLAVMLSELTGKYFKKLTQSFIFLPYFVSWVIVGSIAYNLLNYESGSLNSLLGILGLEPVNAYAEPSWWKYIIVIFSAWKNVGYGMIVYLAAVMGIDTQLYESSEIDGANIFQRIRHITLPSITPTMVTLVLLEVGKIFRGNLDLFYQLIGNNGMLFDATDVIDTFVFRSLTQSGEIGMAAATGFYQSVLCFVTIILVNGIVKRVQKDYALF